MKSYSCCDRNELSLLWRNKWGTFWFKHWSLSHSAHLHSKIALHSTNVWWTSSRTAHEMLILHQPELRSVGWDSFSWLHNMTFYLRNSASKKKYVRRSICSQSHENNVSKIWSCERALESVQQRISDRLHISSQAKVAEGFCLVRPTFWRPLHICYFGICHYFNWTSSTLEKWSHWDQSIVNLWWSHILYSAILFCCYSVTLVLCWSRDAVSGLQRYIKHT